ncbi:molecular chaperone [Burkholderia territorii]|uniref:fimbrial biogenesis chaperone n=1 Tax=Burkholderia territorii TaxID=1503055 RepID=UPI000AB0E2E1|nr:molecular chaperone [Burkholderia territorii]
MKIKSTWWVPCLVMVVTIQGHAFGIDKLSAELDVSRGFKSIATFVVFNDESDETIFVTARGLKWDADDSGGLITTPSRDLEIFPSVQKIGPGSTAAFKVRYSGTPPQGEGSYRVLFTQVRLPSGPSEHEGRLTKTMGEIDQGISVGLAMTVPIYVSDFSSKSNVLDQISASVVRMDNKSTLEVVNKGDRHVTITGYRLNGTAKPGLGVVLPGRSRDVPLDAQVPIQSLEVEVSSRGKTKTIVVNGGK